METALLTFVDGFQKAAARAIDEDCRILRRTSIEAPVLFADQGYFPQMHDYLMTESEWMDGLPWEEVATAAGIPSASEFIECPGSGAAAW